MPNENPLDERGREAARTANYVRSDAIMRIAAGKVRTPTAIVDEAAEPAGKALLKIPLLRLLEARPGKGEKSALKVLTRLLEYLDAAENPRDLTIAWLIDSRVGGTRYVAWTEVIDGKTKKVHPVWPGFPFADDPECP